MVAKKDRAFVTRGEKKASGRQCVFGASRAKRASDLFGHVLARQKDPRPLGDTISTRQDQEPSITRM